VRYTFIKGHWELPAYANSAMYAPPSGLRRKSKYVAGFNSQPRTRPAPAGENAGRGSPSPLGPLGEGKESKSYSQPLTRPVPAGESAGHGSLSPRERVGVEILFTTPHPARAGW